MSEPTLTPPSTPPRHDSAGPTGAFFWAGLVAGGLIAAFGLRGLLDHIRPQRLANLTLFFGASGVVHDALWAPVLVVGAIATRYLPAAVRLPVRVGLALSVGLVLLTTPLLVSDANARNPSSLPLDYGRNLLVTLGVLWAVIALGVLMPRIRRRTP